MGFSEFRAVHKAVSERLLGIQFEDEELLLDNDETNATVRFQSGVKKVVLANRFINLSRKHTHYELESFIRRACYFVASRVFGAPFEVAFIRGSSGLTLSHPLEAWFLEVTPVLAFQSLLTHTADSFKSTSIGLPIMRFFINKLLAYPLEVAVSRKVVLNQAVGSVPLLALYNGFSVFLFVDGTEKLISYVYDSYVDDSFSSWLFYTVGRFALSVPLCIIRQHTIVSNPNSSSPASMSPLESIQAVVEQHGVLGLFSNIGSLALLMPPMLLAFVGSQLVIHKLLGPTSAEKRLAQVQVAKDSVVLRTRELIPVKTEDHFDELVAMGSRSHRLLVLLAVDEKSEMSENALAAAKYMAKELEVTVLVGDVHKLQFIKRIAHTTIPFFLPIAHGDIEPMLSMAFSPSKFADILAEVKEMIL